MRLMENRRLAALVCALCVLVSVFGFGGMKLRSKAASLEETFVEGTDPALATRHSMDEYLDRCAASAADLAQEAKRHLDDAKLIDSVAHSAELLSGSNGMEGRYAVYQALSAAVEELYTALELAGAADEGNVSVAYHDYASAQNLIKNDGFRKEAAAYNEVRGAFPASVIAAVWGLDEAETYGW